MTTNDIARYDETASINVWVGNLRKYNEGELSGDWISLPLPVGMDSGDVFTALGINLDTDEYFIADMETEITGLEYDEYADLDELNDIAETWDALDDYERAAVMARLELIDATFSDALANRDDVHIWHDCLDMTDVAYAYIEECGILHDVPVELQNYFDYEAFGRDLDLEGYFTYSADAGCMIEVF